MENPIKPFSIIFLLALSSSSLLAQEARPPIMGWSCWNNSRINIDEEMIRGQADAKVLTRLYDAGYCFINIDDGYFEGRDADGYLLEDRSKFPSGMKAQTDYIHTKGLKTGIYLDAGRNTYGSFYEDDKMA